MILSSYIEHSINRQGYYVPANSLISKSRPVERSGVAEKGQNQLKICPCQPSRRLHRQVTYVRASSHARLDILEDANIVRKLLLLNAHLEPIRPIQVAAKVLGSPQQCTMPFNLPRLDSGDICPERP